MKRLAGVVALALSWLVVFWMLSILTEFVLVPWDTAVVRPEVGTWQRSLNDFFEMPPGSLLIPFMLLIGSVYVVIRSRYKHLLLRAGVNIAFAAGVFALFMLSAFINNAVFPYPPVLFDPTYRGYHRSLIPGLTVVVACIGWLLMQARIGRLQPR